MILLKIYQYCLLISKHHMSNKKHQHYYSSKIKTVNSEPSYYYQRFPLYERVMPNQLLLANSLMKNELSGKPSQQQSDPGPCHIYRSGILKHFQGGFSKMYTNTLMFLDILNRVGRATHNRFEPCFLSLLLISCIFLFSKFYDKNILACFYSQVLVLLEGLGMIITSHLKVHILPLYFSQV